MYYIVGTKKQYESLYEALEKIIPDKVLDSLYKKVTVLDENYGDTRNLQKSLGGYCAVFPTIEDCKKSYQTILDKHFIQAELYEYQEEIMADDRYCWIEELYMISSDYGIVMFYPKISKNRKGVLKI